MTDHGDKSAAERHRAAALMLHRQGRLAEAEQEYRTALSFDGSHYDTMEWLGALCLQVGKIDEAIRWLGEAAERCPDTAAYHDNLAAALMLLDRVEALFPQNPNALLLRATVLGRMGKSDAALALLDQMAVSKTTLAPVEWLEKGRLLDRMGRHAEAFAAFDAGKQRLREVSGQSYLDAHAQQLATRLQKFFSAKRLATLPRATARSDVAQPLFILGFPRSGTTLLEQTLSAHPRISAGDELPFIAEIAELMPRLLESPLAYPEALAELWMGDHREDLDNLRDHYLRRVAKLGIVPQGAAWFTDKMPLNETHLGLIGLIFPTSPLLHVTRHPLDVVLSVYSNLLTHGHYCAYALESAARHYAQVLDLVEHYRREMQLNYLRVRYEDMVDQQETTIRQVLKFIGVEFDPACLAFHENRRYARTASYAQVTEKLYERSRYRYRNYLPQLQSAIEILAPTIERLGYTL